MQIPPAIQKSSVAGPILVRGVLLISPRAWKEEEPAREREFLKTQRVPLVCGTIVLAINPFHVLDA